MEMNHINLRKLNPSQLFSLRKDVVRLKNRGYDTSLISELTGLNPRQINKIWSAYLAVGEEMEALRPCSCGRKRESGKLLTDIEAKNIRSVLIEGASNQQSLEYQLWTRENIAKLIEREYGKVISPRSLTNYLKEWELAFPTLGLPYGFSQSDYDTLKIRAKKSHFTLYRLYAVNISKPKRHEMIRMENGSMHVGIVPAEEPIDVLYAVPSKGATRFLVVHNRNKQSRQIDFLQRLLKKSSKSIVIIDNFRLDIGSRMQKFLERNRDNLEIIEIL